MHADPHYIDALIKSEAPFVPIFREIQEDPMVRIHRLAQLALVLIRRSKQK